MYAAHFAAGMAIGSHAPRAPTWALLVGAFLPDFLWIGLAAAGVEPTATPVYFDDWSHSLATVVVWATVFAACFRGRGAAAVWLAVFSHFLLDAPIHPKPLGLYPYSSLRLGWGTAPRMEYWLVQLAVVVVLAGVYVVGARRQRVPGRWIAVTVGELLALHTLGVPH
jgi:hypothetical protein